MINEAELTKLSYEMTEQTGDPLEAFEQWQHERDALAELYDENVALRVMCRRFAIALEIGEKIMRKMESDNALFLAPEVRKKLTDFYGQWERVKDHIAHLRDITGTKGG